MLATSAGQKKPASHWFVRSAALPSARHEPELQAAHCAALPYMVRDATVCETLTVPVHVAAVHGLGESVRMVVPAATPAPERICPTTSRPDAIAVTESAAAEMLAVTVPTEL